MKLVKSATSLNRRIENKMARYEPLVPPFSKATVDFDLQETKAYFQWYMEHVDERCRYLTTIVSSELHCKKSVFDFTFNSLIPLWRWFLKDAEVVFDENNNSLLSAYSTMILRDIGMYIGEVFIHQYAGFLKWAYVTKPKWFPENSCSETPAMTSQRSSL